MMIEQLQAASGPLRERLQPLIDLVSAVLRRDPSITAQQQILVAAIVFLLVAFLVILLLLVFTPRKRRVLQRRRVVRSYASVEEPRPFEGGDEGSEIDGSDTAAGAPGPTSTPQWRRTSERLLLGIPGMMLVVVLFFGVTYGVSSTNAFCTFRCHQDLVAKPEAPETVPLTATGAVVAEVETATAEPSYHTRCAGCHRSGVVSDVMDRSRMVLAAFAGSGESSTSAVIATRSCLSCHRAILAGTVTGTGSNVMMSHKEPYEAGMSCDFCHGRTGHEGATSPQMSSCSECHDGVRASTECSTCHASSPSDQSTRDMPQGSADKRVYRAVPLDDNRCYECHRPAPCDSCHQVRVPHTAAFVNGRHAYYAAWDRKKSCTMCHTTTWCQQCHLSFAAGHYDGWEQDHVQSSPTSRCACHDRRNPQRTEPFCTVCHWPAGG